jgi:hypothetical protein
MNSKYRDECRHGRRYQAGYETARDDAKRGVTFAPRRTDDPSWADGYRAACAEMEATLGPGWLAKSTVGKA